MSQLDIPEMEFKKWVRINHNMDLTHPMWEKLTPRYIRDDVADMRKAFKAGWEARNDFTLLELNQNQDGLSI